MEHRGNPDGNEICYVWVPKYNVDYMVAIVLDGHLKSALAAVRSLGAEGISVSVGAERKTAMSFASKYATSTCIYPSPLTDPDGFMSAVEAHAVAV